MLKIRNRLLLLALILGSYLVTSTKIKTNLRGTDEEKVFMQGAWTWRTTDSGVPITIHEKGPSQSDITTEIITGGPSSMDISTHNTRILALDEEDVFFQESWTYTETIYSDRLTVHAQGPSRSEITRKVATGGPPSVDYTWSASELSSHT